MEAYISQMKSFKEEFKDQLNTSNTEISLRNLQSPFFFAAKRNATN